MFNRKPDEAKAAPSSAANHVSAQKQGEPPKIDFRYVDRPECLETYADSLTSLLFDGQVLRLEFGVSRLDERKPDAPWTGRRYPVCRLVLPPAAAIDLVNKLQQMATALAQSGVTKPQDSPGR
jgi:hypothetical protein